MTSYFCSSNNRLVLVMSPRCFRKYFKTSFTVKFVCTYITEILFFKTELVQATLGQSLALARLEMLNTIRGKTTVLGYLRRTEEHTYKTRESQQPGHNILHKTLNPHKISVGKQNETFWTRSKGGQFILWRLQCLSSLSIQRVTIYCYHPWSYY
jgi:hypothetical protein